MHHIEQNSRSSKVESETAVRMFQTLSYQSSSSVFNMFPGRLDYFLMFTESLKMQPI